MEVPQKGALKSDFRYFFNKMLVPHSATRLAAPVTLVPHRMEYGMSHTLTPSSSPVTVLYYTVLYCTVLYCTVLYCTVLYCTVLYIATLPHCHIVSSHCVLTLCPGIVSRHCVQTLSQDIVSVNSMYVACCWVASPGGWDPEGPKSSSDGRRPPALHRS